MGNVIKLVLGLVLVHVVAKRAAKQAVREEIGGLVEELEVLGAKALETVAADPVLSKLVKDLNDNLTDLKEEREVIH